MTRHQTTLWEDLQTMTSEEVCKVFKISRRQLSRWILAGLIQSVGPGRRLLFLKSDVQKLLLHRIPTNG